MATRLRPDELVDLLRQGIRERVLAPGQPLNQDELARRFGVSRIPLREALRTLAGEGLIVMRPGIGAMVTELRADELDELFDLRMRLEPALTATIVGRISESDLAELHAQADAIAKMAASGERPAALERLHYAFHRRLFEFSSQRHTRRLLIQVLNLMEPYLRLDASLAEPETRVLCDHAALLQAIADGDSQAVEELVREALTRARARLQRAQSEPASQDLLSALLVDMPR